MNGMSIFSNLMRELDGSYSFTYGPFVLYSALQPIFSQSPEGILEIEGFEGLVRPARNQEPVRPAEFFPIVAAQDFPMIDSRCRTLHIANTGLLHRSKAQLFVNFHPRLFTTTESIREEVGQILRASAESGMTPDRIVCEIAQKENDSADMLYSFVRELRSHGFRIAIDDYGAGESDMNRIKVMKPDYVKFEASWVKNFMENSAGAALLRVMVSQFRDNGIEAIFEGLEELWQVDLCQDIGVKLMQGYALSQPEIAPTTFNERFPEAIDTYVRPVRAPVARASEEPVRAAVAPRFGTRGASTFGKRGR